MQAIERMKAALELARSEVLDHITTLEAENERLRAESEERLQNAVALVAEVERLRAEVTRPESTDMTLMRALVQSQATELARLRKDAERYRWLRQNPTFLGWEGDFSEAYIDREVDDAMKGEKP